MDDLFLSKSFIYLLQGLRNIDEEGKEIMWAPANRDKDYKFLYFVTTNTIMNSQKLQLLSLGMHTDRPSQ